MISAADGIMFTTSGPQEILVGDNPGGKETVAAIPHDNPGPTLEKIAKLFGGTIPNAAHLGVGVDFGDRNQQSIINETINLKISGNEIVNQTNLKKKIKLTVGEDRDRFG